MLQDTDKYKIPSATSSEKDRLGMLLEFRQQGESFIRQQRAYMDFDKALDLISGIEDRIPKSLSRIKNNQLKRDIREAVASISNIRPTWTYQSGDRKADDKVHALNKRQQYWYYQTFADMQIRSAFQYAGVLGTGFVVPHWKRKHWGYGKGDIALKVLSPRDVLPVQLPPSNDLQDAYCVIIRHETPINMAWAMWPEYQDMIVPDRESPSALMRASNAVLRFISPALNVGGNLKGKENQTTAWPTVDIYWAYIMDMSINTTGREMTMGEPGTSWSYTVPYIGQEIPDGTYGASGPRLRRAEPEDCLLYPNRRLVCFTNNGILRDGPNYDIHGMVPAVPFRFDSWAWEWLGFSLVRDTANIHLSATRLLRSIDDSQNARLRPPLSYNENTISENLASRFDARLPGVQIPANLDMGKPFELLIPAQYYDGAQSPQLFAHIKDLYAWAKQMIGLGDLTALAKAKQVPSSDSIEKLMEMAGPLITDMSRCCEASLVQVADIWKGLALQYYSTRDRLQKVGEAGAVDEDIDYDPGTMIPSHMPGENPNYPSAFSRLRRSKHAMDAISTYVNPQSVHELTNVSKRMSLLLLKKAGLKLDSWTIAKAFNIDNYGPEPQGTKNVYERWLAEQHIDRELAQELQGGMPQPGQGRGRPNTNQKPPTPATKDGGTRVTMKTS